MNRYKKEEKRRGKKFPTVKFSEEEFNELLNYYDDTTESERRKESLAPELRKIDELAKKLSS